MPAITAADVRAYANLPQEVPQALIDRHIAIAARNGAAYNPSAGQTALRRERARRPIERRSLVGTNSWRVTVTFGSDTPAFYVREIGFFDAAGALIAIWAGTDISARLPPSASRRPATWPFTSRRASMPRRSAPPCGVHCKPPGPAPAPG